MSKSTTKKKKKNDYSFCLQNIDTAKVDGAYGTRPPKEEESDSVDGDLAETTTKLTELNTAKGTPELVSFVNDARQAVVCAVSMIDFRSQVPTTFLRYHCYWCRNPFTYRPIGCPIRYVPNQAIKEYYSHISRDTYTITQELTPRRRARIRDPRITVKPGRYYETDGVFCSFNCCQAWINDNKHNRMYDQSALLLMKMYNEYMNTKLTHIDPAPHWRVLNLYGGDQTIDQFRESFGKVEHVPHGTTQPLPAFNPMGNLYELKHKF